MKCVSMRDLRVKIDEYNAMGYRYYLYMNYDVNEFNGLESVSITWTRTHVTDDNELVVTSGVVTAASGVNEPYKRQLSKVQLCVLWIELNVWMNKNS